MGLRIGERFVIFIDYSSRGSATLVTVRVRVNQQPRLQELYTRHSFRRLVGALPLSSGQLIIGDSNNLICLGGKRW